MKKPNIIFRHLVKYSDKYHRKSSLIHHIFNLITDICTFFAIALIIGALSNPGTSTSSALILGVEVELGVMVILAAISSIIYVTVLAYAQIKQNMDYTRKWLKHHNHDKKN